MWKAICILGLICVSFCLGRYTIPTPIEKIETLYDTIREPAPPPIIIESDEYKELYFDLKNSSSLAIGRLRDSISNSEPRIEYDTITKEVKVYVPMNDYTFQDSLYKATMRGYNIHNFAIELYQRNEIRTEIYTIKKQPKWGVGIQAGYGLHLSNERISANPYIGIGVQYNLFTF